jgi:uncharacterized protein YndB with AHSA1/START domain
MATESIQVSGVIRAPPDRIYEAWLDSAEHSAMTGGRATIDANVGGRFTAWDGYIEGATLELEPGRRIVQRWRTTEFPADAADSLVEIRLEPLEDGTRIIFLHSEIPEGQRTRYEQNWREHYLDPMDRYFASTTDEDEDDDDIEDVDDVDDTDDVEDTNDDVEDVDDDEDIAVPSKVEARPDLPMAAKPRAPPKPPAPKAAPKSAKNAAPKSAKNAAPKASAKKAAPKRAAKKAAPKRSTKKVAAKRAGKKAAPRKKSAKKAKKAASRRSARKASKKTARKGKSRPAKRSARRGKR